jgi:hypothetical protein
MTDLQLESSIKSLTDYLKFCEENFEVEFWIGGNLHPFDLIRGKYHWVLFQHNLSPGAYRLCLMLHDIKMSQPIRAYGLVFSPGEKIPSQVKENSFGYGFNITPAVAIGNNFNSSSNLTDFRTRFNGLHQLGVTTLNWNDGVESTYFELLLLKNRSIKYSGDIPLPPLSYKYRKPL